MKKIFWTSIFCLGCIVLFWAYVRLFNQEIAITVAQLFSKELPQQTWTISTGQSMTAPIFSWLDLLTKQIDIAIKRIAEIKTQEAEKVEKANIPVMSTATSTVVKLYYFNEKEDKLLPIEQQANPNSLSPIFRTIPATNDLIRDTISLLLQWALTDSEFKDGFSSSFIKAVRLTDVNLGNDWLLSLTFIKAPAATIWWSAFVGILSEAITKTALQFPQVKSVTLLPEELFQP